MSGRAHIDQIDCRIDLIVVGKAAQTIPAYTKICSQLLGDLPGIFQIDPGQQIDLVGIVYYPNGKERRSFLIAGGIDVEHQ